MNATKVKPLDFLNVLQSEGVEFYTGVPDSLLKEFNACILNNVSNSKHVIAANEGSAIGIAIGHYLSSGKAALVYMQNSGIGNSINPLVSLCDPKIMSCPLLLLIGWRGEILDNGKQLKDEPQHIKQGEITPCLLKLLGIPHFVLGEKNDPLKDLQNAIFETKKINSPVAILVRKESFSKWSNNSIASQEDKLLSREKVINTIIDILPKEFPIICTTGMPSRELFELRIKNNFDHNRDLLCVGGMGHAISISTGIAMSSQKKKVVCIDGDGSMIMHLGAITNSSNCKNIIHIVLNNGAHDSVGGQPTQAKKLDLSKIALSCGYKKSFQAFNEQEIKQFFLNIENLDESCFLEIKCKKGNRKDLGRPTKSPLTNKENFMKFMLQHEK